jgi:DNA-binding GntR family transcriptional regulator
MPPRTKTKPKTAKGQSKGAKKAANGNLNEKAYTTIKDDIISCALQPGEEISEAALVARYGLSKAPIRSALMRLRQEGLVVSRGRLGNIVTPVTLRDVQEISQLRLVLEVTATRLAAGKVDAERIDKLNRAVQAGYEPGNEKSEAAYLKANREFHRYVAEASGNRRLAALVIDLMEQHERIVHLGLALQKREHEFLHFHDELVSALIEGDGDRAAELTERALRGGLRKVMEALLSSANQISVVGADLQVD